MQQEMIDSIARAAHEVNAAFCRGLGDHSQPDWKHAPEWQKESARNGVQLYIDQPETTPEQSHNSWLAEKEANGWSYGPTKDPDRKLHPCIVTYSRLPMEQRAKDTLFGTVVRALISRQDSAADS